MVFGEHPPHTARSLCLHSGNRVLRESGEIPMTIAIMNLAIQAGAAAPRPATTQQAPATGANEDLGTTIREAIRSSVQAQAAASQARAAAAAQRGQATPSPEPTVVFRRSARAPQTLTV